MRPDDLRGCEWLGRGFGPETLVGCLACQGDGFCLLLSENGQEPAEVKEAGPRVEVAKGEEQIGLEGDLEVIPMEVIYRWPPL